VLGDRYAQLRDELRRLIEEFNLLEDGAVEIRSEYLLLTARARGE
jgi:hypothetical protein